MQQLRGGLDVKQAIWDGLRPVIEEWVGRPVYETSLYGIRKYTGGAVLATRKLRSLGLVIAFKFIIF